MLQAVDLARRGLFTAHPNPRVGCLIVKNDRVIGQGWHRRAGLGHAEVEALDNCTEDPQGATVYVTLEPCSFYGKTPPCSEALLAAKVARVITGSRDPNPRVDSLQKLQRAGIKVLNGCEESACLALNPGFFSRMQRHRPWVRVKMAMSLDGRTALANGVSQWITSPEARDDVQWWRAQSDCILTGIGTVLSDNPKLTTRLSDEVFQRYGHGGVKQPLLAIADSALQTSVELNLFNADRDVVVYSAKAGSEAHEGPFKVVQLAAAAGRGISLEAMLQDLAAREINEVHVEAGATLCASLIKASLADELLLYLAPHLLGSDARGLFNLTGLNEMADRLKFEFAEVRQVGPDLRLLLRPAA